MRFGTRTKNRISMSGRGMMLSWLEGSSCFWFRMLGCQLRTANGCVARL